MSKLRVTVEPLTIHPHPDADALELAQVGLYRAVVAKGVYKTGDLAVYIPEQAVLPPALIEELGLTGRLAGAEKNRVRAVRLRGELSQGIVCRPAELDYLFRDGGVAPLVVGEQDYAGTLGITKWVPPVPVGMAGVQIPAPDLMPWIDIENIARYPGLFDRGEQVHANEKIHGSACLYTLLADGTELVSSKGVGARSTALAASDTNLYWRAVRHHRVREAALWIMRELSARRVGIFGEVFGSGVQDLTYGADASRDETIGYAAFDVAVDVDHRVRWIDAFDLDIMLHDAGLPTVPSLYFGPYDEDTLIELASGPSLVERADHPREGLVVRPAFERHSPLIGSRAIGKIVSPWYLTRKNPTEYE